MEMSILTWVLTYALHSTVLIGSVWLLCTLVPRLSLTTKESLWKVALAGGVLTASLHLASGVQPPWGDLRVPPTLDTEPVIVHTAPTPSPEAVEAPDVERRIVRHHTGDMTVTTVRERRAEPAASAMASTWSERGEPSPWPWLVLGLIGLGSIYALTRLVLAAVQLRKQLRGRRDVIEDPVLETFLALCQKAGLKKRVRLTASPHLQSPVALLRREIVLPERAVDSLGPAHQEGMLAHELAHLLRRDPLWLWIAAGIEALFFFQPLNHVARRQIQHLAEYQCDDWAARHTGTGVHLAKCLAEVASWIESGPGAPTMAVPMADPRSPIVRRITRLLDDKRRKADAAHPAAGVAMGLALLGIVTWLAPGVTRAAVVEPMDAPTASRRAASMATNVRDERDDGVSFADVRGEDGIDRAHVRVDTDEEIVRVEIERARPEPPPPPPRDEGVRIIIRGGWGGPLGGHWHGFLGIDVDSVDDLIDEAIDDAFDDDPCASSYSFFGAPHRVELRGRHRCDHGHTAARRARDEARAHARDARRHAQEARVRAREARARAEAQRDAGLFEL